MAWYFLVKRIREFLWMMNSVNGKGGSGIMKWMYGSCTGCGFGCLRGEDEKLLRNDGYWLWMNVVLWMRLCEGMMDCCV